MSKKSKSMVVAGSMLALSLLVTMPALAANQKGLEKSSQTSNNPTGSHPKQGPGIMGTVSAISGTNISVTAKKGVVYSVDATNASIMKAGIKVTTAEITVGDKVMVRGTVTGTNVIATTITDGTPKLGQKKVQAMMKQSALGSVTAVNGSSFTVMPKAMPKAKTTPTAITVNTSATTVFKKDGKAATITDLSVGQNVIVNGAIDATTNTIADAKSVNIVTHPVTWQKSSKGVMKKPATAGTN